MGIHRLYVQRRIFLKGTQFTAQDRIYISGAVISQSKGGSRMNHLRQKKVLKAVAFVLSLITMVILAFPPELSADECDRALTKCLIDAGFGSFLGLVGGFAAGNIPGALIGVAATAGVSLTFCLVGYDFCKRYYQ
jgi:hypothetical protein